MDKVLSWTGWAGVGAIAQIIALLTVLGAVWRYFVLRRQMPIFSLSWDVIGSATIGSDEFHVVEFRNVGRGPGELMDLHLVSAWAQLDSDHRTPGSLGSGESFQLLVSSEDLGAAWLRYMVRTHDHRKRVTIAWRSLAKSGPRGDQFDRELDAWTWRSYAECVQDLFRVQAVAPGGIPHATYLHRPGKREKLLGMLAMPDASIAFPTTAGRADPPTLKYVSPPAAAGAAKT